MTKLATLAIVLLCVCGAFPVECLASRWFSASYTDLQVAMRRYGHCVSSLGPMRSRDSNESEFLIAKMRAFLDQANLENEQLSNLTLLMDSICRPEPNPDYPISVYVDINLFNGTAGKRFRCRAIDTVMDSMYDVFKRAASNTSEALDFSVIQYYPNATNTEASYNLTDLINTSWIKSDTQVEHVCKITSAVKDYIRERIRTSPSQRREALARPLGPVWDFIDRYILEPILGLQRRLYWESSNSYEIVYSGVSNQLGNLGRGFGNRIKTTRDRLSSMFPPSSRAQTNSATNATVVQNSKRLNSTILEVQTTTTTAAPEMSQTTIMSPAPIVLQSSVSSASLPATTVLPAKFNATV